MRDNCRTKKLILLMALVALIGAGFGYLSDDLSPAVVSYADDPGGPAPTGSLAIVDASDPLFAPIQAMRAASTPVVTSLSELSLSRTALPAAHMPASVLTLPQRC
ncbi:MAG: hypothetical protein ACRD3E_16655 [Terriglobales bacterium]